MHVDNSAFILVISSFLLLIFYLVVKPKFLDVKLPKEGVSLRQRLRWAWQQPDLRKRIWTQGAFMLLVIVFSQISLPFFRQPEAQQYFVSGLLPDPLEEFRLSLFQLGVGPFLSACIFFQFLLSFIPPLRAWCMEFSKGRFRSELFVVGFSLIFIFTMSFSLVSGLKELGWFSHPAYSYLTFAVLIFSTIALVVLGYVLEKYFITRGISCVAVSLILGSLVSSRFDILNWYFQWKDYIGNVVFVSSLVLILSYIINRLTSVKIKSEYQTKTQKLIKVPLSFWALGPLPFLFASKMILFPHTLNISFPNLVPKSFLDVLSMNSYINLIFCLSCLYLGVLLYRWVFIKCKDDQQLAIQLNLIDKTQASDLLKFFRNKIWILSLSIFIFFACVFIFNFFVVEFWGMSFSFLPADWIILLLTFIGFRYDLGQALEFYHQKAGSQAKNWVKIDEVWDEIRSSLKKQALEKQGVSCLIKPLRFTWAMPARTFLDSYEIYVPESQKQKAMELLSS